MDNALNLAALSSHIQEEADRLRVLPTIVSHADVLNAVLARVEPLDFWAESGAGRMLKDKHYVVPIIGRLLHLAKEQGLGLCRRSETIYVYNGAYWKTMDEDEIRSFLCQAALRMGMKEVDAVYVNFVDKLVDQFKSMAYQRVVKDDGLVKINLQNGTYVFGPDGHGLRPFDREDFMTHQLPFAFDEAATAPLFSTFLNRVQPDESCQRVLAEYLGYVFIPSNRLKLEKVMLLYGSGANGKSVFFDIVCALLGRDNVSNYTLESITTSPAYARAKLEDKLINYASEINGKQDTNVFKQMVSGEPVEARLPYGQPFTMTHYAKLIFNCNELPSDVEHNDAYFRRFLIVPFDVTIPEAERDTQLAPKIIANELAGIFNWVLAGLQRLLEQERYTECEAIQEQVDTYRQQSDSVRCFLDEQGYVSDPDGRLGFSDLMREYRLFCHDNGYHPVNLKNFRSRLKSCGIGSTRRSSGMVVFVSKTSYRL